MPVPERSGVLCLVCNFMARRMFSPDIVESDAFLDMSPSTQALYFHLGMRADDDGFVNPKMVMRLIGSTEDELKVLLVKRFLLKFESGVVVIKHWLIHNLIRADLYKETLYTDEKSTLGIKDNGAYTELRDGVSTINKVEAPQWLKIRRGELSTANVPQTALRIGKDRIGKVSKDAEESEDGVEVSLFENGGGIQHDFQFKGLEIFEKTGAPPNKKSECIRLAKKYPNFIDSSLSFCLDYPNPALKWKMFLWKINSLINPKNEIITGNNIEK